MAYSEKHYEGKKRPARGPYPKGVVNGPHPTTKRGWKRRIKNVDSKVEKA